MGGKCENASDWKCSIHFALLSDHYLHLRSVHFLEKLVCCEVLTSICGNCWLLRENYNSYKFFCEYCVYFLYDSFCSESVENYSVDNTVICEFFSPGIGVLTTKI